MNSPNRPENLEQLEIRLNQAKTPVEIATVLKKIAFTGEIRALTILRVYLSHEDSRVRANAVESIGYFQKPEVIPVLADQLEKETDPRVRGNLIRVLWKLGHRNILAELKKMVDSGIEADIKSAFYVCGFIADEQALEIVKDAFINGSGEKQKLAENTLRTLNRLPSIKKDKKKYLIPAAVTTVFIVFLLFYLSGKKTVQSSGTVDEKKLNEIRRMIDISLLNENYALALDYIRQHLLISPDQKISDAEITCLYRLGRYQDAADWFSHHKGDYTEEVYVYRARTACVRKEKEIFQQIKADYQEKYGKNGRFSDLINLYQAVAENDSLRVVTLSEDIYLKSEVGLHREFKEAAVQIREYLNRISENSPLMFSVLLLQTGKFDAAIDLLRTRILKNADDVRSYYLLGECYKRAGKTDAFRRILWQLYSLKPEEKNALCMVAESYLEQGETAQAEYYCSLDQGKNANQIEYVKNAIICKKGQMRKSLEKLEAMIPECSDIWLLKKIISKIIEISSVLGLQTRVTGIFDRNDLLKTKSLFNQILKIRVETEICSRERAFELIADLNRLRNVYPESVALLNLAGIVFARAGELDKAEKIFTEGFEKRKLFSDRTCFVNNLGVVSAMSKNRNALEIFRRASKEKNISVLYNSGVFLMESDPQQSAYCFQSILEKDPYQLEVINNLAVVFYRMNLTDVAEMIFQSLSVSARENIARNPVISENLTAKEQNRIKACDYKFMYLEEE